jgi:hypothetical protein
MKRGIIGFLFVPILSLTFFLSGITTIYGADRYSVATGNWNSTNTWSATNNGPPGASVPNSGDVVYIIGGNDVTVDINNAICASLNIGTTGGNTTTSLIFSSNTVLTVIGNIILGGVGQRKGSINMTNGGLLQIGGSLTVTSLGTWTPGSGTIEYNAAGAQAVSISLGAYNNLILSGSGEKSITTGTSVTGNLSISGATASIGAGLNISVGSLTLGGLKKINGTWGSTTSSATHKDNTYFAATTGYVTVTNDTRPTPTFSGLTGSQSICYGTATISLSGTVSATGPIYPADLETVGVTINGSTQNATISGGAGGFSINFTTSTIPASGTPYTITYSYTGDDNLTAAANNISTTLTVNPLPVAPTSAGSDRNNFCADDAGDINLSVSGGSGTSVGWYTSSCGGTSIGTGNPLTIASPTTTTTYYARWETPSCGNSTCANTTVTVLPLPVAPTSASSGRIPFCADDGGDVNLSVTGGSGTTVRWFTGSCGGTDIGTGNPLIIASPTTTTTYYARWENSCGNSTCESVTVTVLALPAANLVNITGTPVPDSISGSSSADICQGLNGTTFVDFRFDRISGTGDWDFDFTIGGTDVSVLATTVTGDLPTNIVGTTVFCDDNDKVYLRFEIDNVPNQTLVVSFSLDYIEDIQCSDFIDNIEAEQTINPIPTVGPFN